MQAHALSKKITECTSEIARLEAERERCNAAIESANQHDASIADLTERRAREVSTAFIENRDAIVAPIDKEIASAEKLGAAARDHGAAARGALTEIDRRCAELRSELPPARKALTALVMEQLGARRVAAQERFNGAVDELRPLLIELRALDAVICTVRGIHSALPGSVQLIDALLEEGLTVWGSGKLYRPGWLRSIGTDAQASHADLVAEFKLLGLDI
jgi:chromosome segregation ATPase